MNAPPVSHPSAPSHQRTGLLLLVVTSIGWGLNWPAMKILLLEWPPMFARGSASLVAAAGLTAIAFARGDSLTVPRAEWPRLVVLAFINVTVWMGLSTVAMQWLSAGEGALVVYTMPIWATLFAWPVLGERPTRQRLAALALGFGGIVLLFAGQPLTATPQKLLGIAFMLTSAILFGFGTVALRKPLSASPLGIVAWQVGLGSLPMLAYAQFFETQSLSGLSSTGAALWLYMTIVPMGVCYVSWFAALRRVAPQTASMATLLVPVVGVVSGAIVLGEPFGPQQWAALGLTLGGVGLALRKG